MSLENKVRWQVSCTNKYDNLVTQLNRGMSSRNHTTSLKLEQSLHDSSANSKCGQAFFGQNGLSELVL
jgi:hypothetical protein